MLTALQNLTSTLEQKNLLTSTLQCINFNEEQCLTGMQPRTTSPCCSTWVLSGYARIRLQVPVSVVLDMLLKFGLLQYKEDELWELADDVGTRRLYSFGDRKSNENCTAFLSTLTHRPLTFKESSMQAEIFLESFWNIMFLPGDWHTGMNMLQSVYKVFWADILGPMKLFLGWKRIAQDVRGCYFQAVRLVRYIHNSLSTYLLLCFVSATFDNITDTMESHQHADIICYVASAYGNWLSEAITSTDQHLRLCAHFISMSGNFLEFVHA